MNKLKTLVLVVLIVLLCTMNFFLELYLAREMLGQEKPEQTWIYDENDKSTWWYERHTIGAGRDSQIPNP